MCTTTKTKPHVYSNTFKAETEGVNAVICDCVMQKLTFDSFLNVSKVAQCCRDLFKLNVPNVWSDIA